VRARLIGAALAVAIAGCGSSGPENGERFATPDHPSGAYRAGLEQACSAAGPALGAGGQLAVASAERLYDGVAALSPPVKLRALHQRLTDDLGKREAIARAQAQAALEGDSPELARTAAAAAALAPRLRDDRRDLAIPACTAALSG
jgi:hypothetical protein